jgi:hypothetical protein
MVDEDTRAGSWEDDEIDDTAAMVTGEDDEERGSPHALDEKIRDALLVLNDAATAQDNGDYPPPPPVSTTARVATDPQPVDAPVATASRGF